MLDVLTLLKAMAAALQSSKPLEWASIAPVIGVRFQGVRPVGRSGSASAIESGTLIDGDRPVDGIVFQSPPRRISLLFPDSTLSDPEISSRQFAPQQRIVPSQTTGGYAIVFNIGEIECAVLASEPGHLIDGLTASEPRREVRARISVNLNDARGGDLDANKPIVGDAHPSPLPQARIGEPNHRRKAWFRVARRRAHPKDHPPMPDEGRQTPLPPSLFARLALAARYAITGVSPDTWFGPQQPLAPQAPPEVKGRQFDYPFGVNLSYVPRSTGGISFAELRALADALPLLRAVIETRKDQIAALSYAVRARDPAGAGDAAGAHRGDARVSSPAPTGAMRSPPGCACCSRTCWSSTPRRSIRASRAAARSISLDVIDGATITPLIGEDGRSPEPPDPAYQQILHGVPAADFSSDELLYLPRNVRAHRALRLLPGRADRADRQHRAAGATRRRSTITAPARPPTPSRRCRRNGRSTRSASSRIISTR